MGDEMWGTELEGICVEATGFHSVVQGFPSQVERFCAEAEGFPAEVERLHVGGRLRLPSR